MEQVTLVKTPNVVFTFAIKCLKESELGFDMIEYYSSGLEGFYSRSPSDVDHPCGTNACIAGAMAYSIDSESKLQAIAIVQTWALGVTANHITRIVGRREFHYACDVFEEVFNNPHTYGVRRLKDVTKDLAITRLRKLSKFDDWESVAVYLNIT